MLTSPFDWLAAAIKYFIVGPREEPVASDRLNVTDSGFDRWELATSKRVAHVAWSAVQEICTYKRDCFAYDEIRLSFRCAGGGWDEVSEQDDGFEELKKAMEANFPEIPKDWFGKVMLPPFATNMTTLWQRNPPQNPNGTDSSKMAARDS
jgi:hypothetical protein